MASALTAYDPSEWKVILKKPDSQQVVLFNEKENQVILQNLSEEAFQLIHTGESICTLCKRPFDHSKNDGCDQKYFEFLSSWFAKDKSETSPQSYKNISSSSFNQGYYQKFFKEGRKLGRGAGGSVYLCQHQIENIPLGEYAVKKVPVGDDKEWLGRLLREVHVLERLRHPNIIEYKHTWIEMHKPSKFGPSVPCLFILMEYANGGNLEDLILAELTEAEEESSKIKSKSKKGKREAAQIGYMDELDILKIFLSTAKGLHHLHALEILHRDLKPANLMLHYERGNVSEPTVLLSDFGECAESNDVRAGRTGATGTMEFVAPELFQINELTNEFEYEHSVETDIWSLGMILYFMYFARLPFENVEDIDVLRDDLMSLETIVIPQQERPIALEMEHLLSKLLQVNPKLRPDLRTVIRTTETYLNTPRKRKSSFAMSAPPGLAASHPVAALEMSPTYPPKTGNTLSFKALRISPNLRSNASIACKIVTLLTLFWQILGCYPWSLSTVGLVLAFFFLFSLRSRYNFPVIVLMMTFDFLLIIASPRRLFCSSV